MSKSQKREERQIKVFTKWCNSYLRKKGVEVSDLTTAFSDGVNLCYLFEIISEEKLPRYNLKPKGMIQKTNNLAIALKRINSFVKECGIGLQYSPQQVAAGDARQILGMLWILITKFVVPESEESLSRKRSLLRWVQRVTEKYDNVAVKDFTRSWQDGLAFNALLDQFDNTLMDYSKLTKDKPAENCENAFKIAAEKLDIYRLLDVEDVVNDDIPDEKSVMTYVATLYQYFHSQAGRKLEQEAKQLVIDIGRLLEWIKKSIQKHQIPEEWVEEQEPLEKMLENCWGLEKDLHKFNEEKALYANVKAKMYLDIAKIQRVQRNERINIFNPPKEKNMSVLHKDWSELNDVVIKYSAGLRDEVRRIEELIRKRDEEWIELKEKNAQEKREEEKQRLEDLLKIRDEDEEDRQTKEREARDADIAEKQKEAEERRKFERKRIEDEINKRGVEEDHREHEEREARDADIAGKEKEANEKREAEKAKLEGEISRREKEEEERRTEERKVRDADIAEKEKEAEEKRVLEKKRLEDEIKVREEEDSKRREEEKRRRELIIKQQEEKAAQELQEKREAKEKEIGEMLKKDAEKRKLMRSKADEDSEKMRDDLNKKREKERKEKEEEIAKKREEDEKERELYRKTKDEQKEKAIAEQKKKNEDEREKVEKEISEKEIEKADLLSKKRKAQDEFLAKKEKEEAEKREAARKEHESVIAEKLEKEKQERHDKREKEINDKKDLEENRKLKLEAYDKESTAFLAWINSTQSELTHVEERGEDEEDLSTDEEKRNKRKQAAADVKEKIKPSLETYEALEKAEIQSFASVPISEIKFAMSTFLFALIGEEQEDLSEIRKFKFPEEQKEE